MKRIAIVGLNVYPIPCIKGGAIEALMTTLLDQNEKNPTFEFTVYTVKDKQLKKVNEQYKYTRIIEVSEKGLLALFIFLYRAIRKLLFRKLPIRTVYMTRINRSLLKNKYDVVLFATSTQQVAELSEKINSKVLYGVYSDYLRKDTPKIDYICKKITAFIANSYIRGRIIEELGVEPKKAITVELGGNINLIDLSLIPEIKKRVRRKFNLEEDEILVAYCGRLSKEKGPLELIKAIQMVNGCKLMIIGGSNFSENKMTDYVKQLRIEADKCNGRVIFTGYVPDRKDAYKYMAAADIGVVPSICNEAGSAAMREFRCLNVPTVISNMGGMPLYRGKGSVLVENDDNYVRNLADAIQRLADNSELRQQLSSVTREGLEENTGEAYFNRFVNMINAL